MLLSDIYKTAAALISERQDGADNADLRERSLYLLYQIVCGFIPLERAIGDEDAPYPAIFTSLDQSFPLSDELAHLCAYKLAYLLIADENTVLCATLRSEFEQCRRDFIDSLQASVSGTVNVYP
ncbi:MAG: hypothetical protein J5879_01520 [Clostridia bacterium]|nr:hypothetical protein [Clostridia bacterium]